MKLKSQCKPFIYTETYISDKSITMYETKWQSKAHKYINEINE